VPGRGRWLGLGLAATLVAWPLAGGERTPPPEELTNFRLGPDLATWLVGPLSRLASAEERTAYLQLADDAAAERFIAEFWERRGGIRPFPPTPGYLFQERVARADVLYREGHHAGHRTDRGTIYALHGAPAAIEFEASPSPGGEPIEIWLYPKDAPPGLDGDSPKRVYSFRRSADGVTRFHSAPIRRRMIDAADPPDGV
jgi:GWxTD domain-containing protein